MTPYATWTAEALALHRKGWSYAAIGRKVDRTRERVRQVLSQKAPHRRPVPSDPVFLTCVFCGADFASTGNQRFCCWHCIHRGQWHRRARRLGKRLTPHLSRWRTWKHSEDCRLTP